MDTELVVSPFLSDKSNEGVRQSASPLSDYFYSALPYYLTYGMSQEEFWDGELELAAVYRKVHELKEDEFNRHAHLQGAYFYEALCDVSPILQAFAEKGTTARPYPEEPYGLTPREESEAGQKKSERDKQTEKAMAHFQALAASWNENFNKERGDEDGGSRYECTIAPYISGQSEGSCQSEGPVGEPHRIETERKG